MFEKFTDTARRVVVQAQEEARGLDQDSIRPEHLLLALMAERPSIAAKALERLGVRIGAARLEVERGAFLIEGHMPFTAESKEALQQSLRESEQFGHTYIGPEHLLLGVLAETSGVVEKVLAAQRVTLESAREQVILWMTPDPIADRLDGIQGSLSEIAKALGQIARGLDG